MDGMTGLTPAQTDLNERLKVSYTPETPVLSEVHAYTTPILQTEQSRLVSARRKSDLTKILRILLNGQKKHFLNQGLIVRCLITRNISG